MKKGIVICLITLVGTLELIAQKNVGFNHLTGTANVSIPLYTVGNVPVSINYSAHGLKVHDVAGMVGLGWQLNAGGSISRQVKGKADDNINGWLNNGAGGLVDTFSTTPNNDCTDEMDEFTQIAFLYSKQDTQPDIFYINTPFISGKFIFDESGSIHVQPYQDIVIDYTLDEDLTSLNFKSITSFTITDDLGVKYEFEVVDYSSRYADFEQEEVFFQEFQDHHNGINSNYVRNWHLSKIKYPNGKYIAFDYVQIEGSPYINKKSSHDGMPKNSRYVGSTEGSFSIVDTPGSTNVLNSITTNDGDRIEFVFSTRNDGIMETRLLRVEKYLHDQLLSSHNLYYKDVYPESFEGSTPDDEDLELNKRTFLESVNFSYNGKIYAGHEFEYSGVYDYYTKLPKNEVSAIDYYGYYTEKGAVIDQHSVLYYYPSAPIGSQFRVGEPMVPGTQGSDPEIKQIRDLIPTVYYNSHLSLYGENQYRVEPLPVGHTAKAFEVEMYSAGDRSVDSSSVHYGSLSKLIYPTGGSTRFYYEANIYYDPPAEMAYYGAGVRLRKTIVNDGVSNANNIETDYIYTNDQGTTSGMMVERPVFAFGTTYSPELGLTHAEINNSPTLTTVEKAEALSIRTGFDIAAANTRVLYERVGVSRKGSGATYFDFNMPATLDEASANNGEWTPTTMEFARNNTNSADCMETGRFTIGKNVYPFADNPNYDFQRGLLNSVAVYSEEGELVTETDYSYIRTTPLGTDSLIYAMSIDKIPSYLQSATSVPSSPLYFYAYGKYPVLSHRRNAIDKVTQTLYDPNDENKKIITETDYVYGGAHKRLSNISTTNSDGTKVKSYTRYVADYNVGTPIDDIALMLQTMQQAHQNGLSVERYSTVTPLTGTETIVSGSLLTFDDFSSAQVLPYQQYVLGKTATITQPAFISSHINSGAFVKDSNYELAQTTTGYDVNAKSLGTINEKAKINTGNHWGYNHQAAIASISNGGAAQLLYAGFEEGSKHTFEFDELSYPVDPFDVGRTGLMGLSMQVGTNYNLIGNIAKSELTNMLILSFWAKASTNGAINYTLKSEDGANVHDNGSVPYAVSSDWQYYSTLLDVSSLDAAVYQLVLSTDVAVSLDDILSYPEEATVSYRSFGNKGELLSASTAGGTTTYYEYDELLRNTLVRDDDGNILNKTDYTDVEITPPINPFFHYKGLDSNGHALFELDDESAIAYDYTWDFGDGTPEVSMTGQSTITHAYIAEGDFTVKLTVTDSVESDSSVRTISAIPNPVVKTCAAGPQVIDVCGRVVDEIFEDGCYSDTGYQLVPIVFSIDEVVYYPDWENETITYSWLVLENGLLTWTEVSTDASVSLMYDESFGVKCEMTIGATSITSKPKWVTLYKTDASCPDLSQI